MSKLNMDLVSTKHLVGLGFLGSGMGNPIDVILGHWACCQETRGLSFIIGKVAATTPVLAGGGGGGGCPNQAPGREGFKQQKCIFPQSLPSWPQKEPVLHMTPCPISNHQNCEKINVSSSEIRGEPAIPQIQPN